MNAGSPSGAYALVTIAGVRRRLEHGQVVGRTHRGFHLPDPSISEAHALCTFREEGLVLLSLRGTLSLDGTEMDSVPLTPGAKVGLGGVVEMEVQAVHLPDTEWAIVLDSVVAALPDGERFLYRDPASGLPAWASAPVDGWVLRICQVDGRVVTTDPDGVLRTVAVETAITTPFGELHFVRRPLLARPPTTHPWELRVGDAETVAKRPGAPTLRFERLQAELLLSLLTHAGIDGRAHWATVAKGVWGRRFDPTAVKDRKRFDNLLGRVLRNCAEYAAPMVVARPASGYLAFGSEYQVERS